MTQLMVLFFYVGVGPAPPIPCYPSDGMMEWNKAATPSRPAYACSFIASSIWIGLDSTSPSTHVRIAGRRQASYLCTLLALSIASANGNEIREARGTRCRAHFVFGFRGGAVRRIFSRLWLDTFSIRREWIVRRMKGNLTFDSSY